jgi:hypothetical protein
LACSPDKPLEPNILLSTLFSNILGLWASIGVGGKVLCPYRTIGKLIISYTLILVDLTGDKKQKALDSILARVTHNNFLLMNCAIFSDHLFAIFMP